MSHAATRLKGDSAVNHVLDCRVERESAWVRKKSVTVKAEEVYRESLTFHTVEGIIPEGEKWENQRKKKIEEVKGSAKFFVNYENEKGWAVHVKQDWTQPGSSNLRKRMRRRRKRRRRRTFKVKPEKNSPKLLQLTPLMCVPSL